MTMQSRHSELIQLLDEHEVLTISEISEKLNISTVTVRRDIAKLNDEGLLRRVPGGALRAAEHRSVKDAPAKASADPLLPHKRAIAAAAVGLVKPGDTIFIDSGSTNNEIARYLLSFSDISIVTNSIEIAYLFISRKDISVYICGGTMGEVNPYSSVVGPLAEKMIQEFRANIAFIGTSGVHRTQGLTCSYLSTARIKQAMIRNSSMSVLVTDYSKFERVYRAFCCGIEEINLVMTDRQAPSDSVAFIRAAGIEVMQVDPA